MAVVTSVGVPVMSQALERVRPAGSAGLTEHAVTVPPVLVALIVPTELLLVKVKGLPEYAITGRASVTVIVRTCEAVPPVFVAVIV